MVPEVPEVPNKAVFKPSKPLASKETSLPNVNLTVEKLLPTKEPAASKPPFTVTALTTPVASAKPKAWLTSAPKVKVAPSFKVIALSFKEIPNDS